MGLIELLLILLIILILFGSKRLPKLGTDLGRLYRYIKEVIRRQRKNPD